MNRPAPPTDCPSRCMSLDSVCATTGSSFATIGWREEAEALFDLANLYTPRMVEIKCSNGRPSDRGLPDKAIPIPTKMGRPVVNPWMKQRDHSIRLGVNAFQAAGFSQVTARTRPRTLLELRRSRVRLGDDMLDVEGRVLQ